MDYQIGIMTRNRVGAVSTIRATGIATSKFTLFTDTEKERREYQKAYPKVSVVSASTKYPPNVRNFMLDYFGSGSNVVMMCDDVEGIYRLLGKSLMKLDTEKIENLISVGFEACRKYNTKLWGIYPIPNQFFMSNTISPNTFIIGTFCGVIVSDIRMDPQCRLKEDYDFTIKHILKYRKIVRFNSYAVKAGHYTNKGGCVDYRNDQIEQESINRLLELYPNFIRLNPKRKNEILLNFK